MKLMASIIKKNIRGHIYYYAVESKRVDGKPRIVWQKYLGKVTDIIQAVSGTEGIPEPRSVRVYNFGAEAALLGIARRLGVEEMINKNAGRAGAGPGIGEYILIYAINACTGSGGKISEWFERTVLRRHFKISPKMLTEKRFWNVAESLSEDVLERIQSDLAEKLISEFGVGTRGLIYHDIKLPGHTRGKARKTIAAAPGSGLLVSSDFKVPLFYKIYPSDFPDEASIKECTEILAKKYRGLILSEPDITVVKHLCFKPGEVCRSPATTPYRVLGMLAADENEELLDIPPDRFHHLKDNRQDEVRVYRCPKKISGKNATILVVFSEKEMAGQLETVKSTLRKSVQELIELKDCLPVRREVGEGRETSLPFVEKRVREILNKPFLKSLVNLSLVFDENGRVDLNFSVNNAAFFTLKEKSLGKYLIITDNTNWDNEEIYGAFNGRAELEEVLEFIQKRVPGGARLSQKDELCQRVNAFYTILGLTLQTLLRRELHRYGVKGSMPEILNTLSGIREVAVNYAREEKRLKKREYVTVTQMDPAQKEIYECLRLKEFEAGG